ncbi:unnamed protein product, partial [Acanthocheilonema viteae]
MSWLSFVSFLSLLISNEAVLGRCPQRCLCHKGLIDCRRQSLLAVPRYLPANTTVLNLADNAIQILPEHFFDYSKRLKTLILNGNPLNCDCRWLSLAGFIHQHSSISPVCHHPDVLRWRQFSSLKSSDFRCFGVKLLDDKRSAKCEVDIKAPITFIYGKEKVDDNNTKGIKILSNGMVLLNSNVSLNELHCAVDYNATIIHQSRLPRQIFDAPSAPKFTLKPKDRSYREGTTVRLDCEVTGKPRPSITWYFNGKKLKRSRKYGMNLEQTSLNIYSFLERDVGKYTCVAENAFGQIETSAEARLISSSPPVITEGPENQKVSLGSTVTFRCRADGEPRPFITWFLNGGEIHILKGHFHVSDDEMELTISGITKYDEGVYSCMAANTVGSMIAEARLIIDHNRFQDNSINDHFIHDVFQQASQNVDSAIEQTREKLSKITNPHELLRWFQFSFPQTIELSRAREIYEESIRLIQKHVEKGLTLPLDKLSSNISIESVLAKSHVDMLVQLAGCSGVQTRDPCDEQCFHSRYSQTKFRRLLPPIYENGFNTPVGWDPNKLYFGYRKPNARSVSKKLLETNHITPHKTYSTMLMQWGQFIDHDLDFTATAISRQAFATGAICNRTCEYLNPCFNIPLAHDDPRMLA